MKEYLQLILDNKFLVPNSVFKNVKYIVSVSMEQDKVDLAEEEAHRLQDQEE